MRLLSFDAALRERTGTERPAFHTLGVDLTTSTRKGGETLFAYAEPHRPEGAGYVGNVGNPGYPVWPPGITGLKITYGSPYSAVPHFGSPALFPNLPFSWIYWGYPFDPLFGFLF